MSDSVHIDRELSAARLAWEQGQDGKARVCARRAVAAADRAWLSAAGDPLWQGDALAHLRRIQQQQAFPNQVRQAAERLTTAVTRRHDAPFTSDPVSDAALIIGHLTVDLPGALLP
ncbi:MAG TPA: hypothetical protein PKV55_06900 [Nitrospira sp.]|nr:hypothetical protein [Nitrospira sp.]MBS0173216.1 hypothetical protein [Nitrospira sp.]MBX3337798.1 hypothetical protein [Nitrospira sp.]MCW5779633.1 hypothetical protein [Nitrospira sp.]HMZ55830.1 hypothetical protein [Nitrospira sp.]